MCTCDCTQDGAVRNALSWPTAHRARTAYACCERALSVQTVRLQQQRDVHAAPPVPPYIASSVTASGQLVGNAYDGQYNRSRLLRPGHAAASGYTLWPVADEAVWFPKASSAALSRVPRGARGTGLAACGAEDGEMFCASGWKDTRAAADLYARM
jgi:hypothetical protein